MKATATMPLPPAAVLEARDNLEFVLGDAKTGVIHVRARDSENALCGAPLPAKAPHGARRDNVLGVLVCFACSRAHQRAFDALPPREFQ